MTPDEIVTDKGSSLKLRTARRSMNSFVQIFIFIFCDTEAPNGIPSSRNSGLQSTFDLVGSPKNIWSINEPRPDVLF